MAFGSWFHQLIGYNKANLLKLFGFMARYFIFCPWKCRLCAVGLQKNLKIDSYSLNFGIFAITIA